MPFRPRQAAYTAFVDRLSIVGGVARSYERARDGIRFHNVVAPSSHGFVTIDRPGGGVWLFNINDSENWVGSRNAVDGKYPADGSAGRPEWRAAVRPMMDYPVAWYDASQRDRRSGYQPQGQCTEWAGCVIALYVDLPGTPADRIRELTRILASARDLTALLDIVWRVASGAASGASASDYEVDVLPSTGRTKRGRE